MWNYQGRDNKCDQPHLQFDNTYLNLDIFLHITKKQFTEKRQLKQNPLVCAKCWRDFGTRRPKKYRNFAVDGELTWVNIDIGSRSTLVILI
jgi:hypothetical protein